MTFGSSVYTQKPETAKFCVYTELPEIILLLSFAVGKLKKAFSMIAIDLAHEKKKHSLCLKKDILFVCWEIFIAFVVVC